MTAPGKRLRRRINFLRLGVDETAARVGMDYDELSRYVSGAAKQSPHPELFVRLCRVLAVTPDQAFGLAPMPGVDTAGEDRPGADEDTLADRDTAERERIRASLNVLDDEGLRLAADLLDSVLRSQQRGGR